MNKVLLPRITFKEFNPDEKRIEMAYARIFEIARRNILANRQLTNDMIVKYTKVQNGKEIFNDRGSGRTIESKQGDSLSVSQKGEDSGV